MTIDQAIALMTSLLQHAVMVAGPVLGAALVGGLVIGVLQTATQINEMSIAYVVKASCVMLIFLFAGTAIVSKAVQFARDNFASVAEVVR